MSRWDTGPSFQHPDDWNVGRMLSHYRRSNAMSALAESVSGACGFGSKCRGSADGRDASRIQSFAWPSASL